MKKFLSIVISILMISAMMSVVAFADTATISMDAITGLVAGESVVLEPTVANGTTYTVSVNNQVFGLVGGTANGSITSVEVTAPATATLTVNSSVPATFTSAIKLQVAGEEAVMVNVSVADRLIGDVNGLDGVTVYDAAQLLAYATGASANVDAGFKAQVADINGLDGVTVYDAAQLLAYATGASANVDAESTANGVGVAYLGGNAATEIVDPFVGGEEPEPEPVKLSTPTNVYAYYQDGKLYYTFDAVTNASSYTIKVGSAEPVAINATSGSITVAAWDGTGTLAVEVKAIGDVTNYTDSDAANANAVYANVSGQLSQWLADNNLSDVAITVYEITAE